jgi:hypothetical protein
VGAEKDGLVDRLATTHLRTQQWLGESRVFCENAVCTCVRESVCVSACVQLRYCDCVTVCKRVCLGRMSREGRAVQGVRAGRGTFTSLPDAHVRATRIENDLQNLRRCPHLGTATGDGGGG